MPTTVNPARKSWMMRTGSSHRTLRSIDSGSSRMPLKHPIRCLSAGFNHAGRRPVAQEIRAPPSCSAASGRRHRDEGGSRDDTSGGVSATRLTALAPGLTRRLAPSPHLNCRPSCRWPTNSASASC
jgi:hypothetical protein